MCRLSINTQIMERALFHMDNSYNIPNIRGTGYTCKTNLPSNTAFRGFGGPQGMMVTESWMSDVALSCGLPAEEVHTATFSLSHNPYYTNINVTCNGILYYFQVRRMNMYKEGDLTHFNQRLEQFTIGRCWEECMQLSDFNKRKDAVEQYNRLEIIIEIELINTTKSNIVRKHVFFDILTVLMCVMEIILHFKTFTDIKIRKIMSKCK